MPQLVDARGNEIRGLFPDYVTNESVTDARPITATLSALNGEVVMDLNGASTATFDLRTAAMNATLVFEGTVDGTNYIGLPALDILTEAYLAAVVITTTLAKTYTVGVTGIRRIRCRVSAYTSGTVVVAARGSIADLIIYGKDFPAQLWVTVTAAANTGATITLPAAGAGLFHYLTMLDITRNATAALAGTATLVITSTNLTGSPAWSVGNAMIAGGTQIDVRNDFSKPIKSSVANTNTTIVMPVPGAAVLWRGNCAYYVGA
jgi:hypothetical protein